MNTLNVIYHLARADFLERVRRYSFLVMLGVRCGVTCAVTQSPNRLATSRKPANSSTFHARPTYG